MGRFKHIVALLLLALWVPLTSHELLEQAGFIHHSDHVVAAANAADTHDHGSDDGDGDHDAADGLCRIDWGGVTLKGPAAAAVLLPLWLTVGEDIFRQIPGLVALKATPPGWSLSPPPERAASWHFALRAALPARAPSPRVLA